MIRALHVKHFHAVKNNIFRPSIEYLHERSTKGKFKRIKLELSARMVPYLHVGCYVLYVFLWILCITAMLLLFITLRNFTSPAWAVAKYCDKHICVCVSVCLSVSPPAYLRNDMRDLYQFFCVCCLWPWLDPPLAGWRNPKGKGAISGLSGPFKSVVNIHCSHRCRVRCKRDHSIVNNVLQQKGSFSMPGKRK